jgi:hypothetical protein
MMTFQFLAAIAFAWLLAGTGLATAATPAPLTPVGEKIFARLRATPDINTICKDDGALRDIVKATVRSMVMSGEVSGRPRDDARAAAQQVKARCGTL